MNDAVLVAKTGPTYPSSPGEADRSALGEAFRGLFRAWGKDPENPFAGMAPEGGLAVIKPNWVADANARTAPIDCLVTHPAIVYLAMHWAARALNGRGQIVVGDAPLQSCQFEELMRQTGVRELAAQVGREYPGLKISVEDWRLTTLEGGDEDHLDLVQSHQSVKPSDPDRYRLCDLGQTSFLEEISDYAERFRVSCYPPSQMTPHHQPGKHEYLVARRALEADLLINLPKMKTHKKAGLTGALKNMVGINGHKEFLPHFIQGSFFSGGDKYCQANASRTRQDQLDDEYWEHQGSLPERRRWWIWQKMRAWSRLARWTGADRIAYGSWFGNETIWRMTLDLNHLVYFGSGKRPRVVNVVDGIVAGEGNGPLCPAPKAAGIVAVGENPAYVDAVLGWLMGYNLARIPSVYHAVNHRASKFGQTPLADFRVSWLEAASGQPSSPALGELPNLSFRKPTHWERASRDLPNPFATVK